MKIFKRGAVGIVVAVLLLAAILIATSGVADASVGSIFTRFRALLVDDSAVIVNDLDVGDDLAVSGLATVGETLAVTGASTLTGAATTGAGLTVGTKAIIGTFINTTAGTSITVTDNLEIIPVGSYQPIVAEAAVGTDSITTTGFIAGDWVTFINTGTDVITITDTGTIMLSGNAALGQYDTLTVMFDGTNWLEMAQTNN